MLALMSLLGLAFIALMMLATAVPFATPGKLKLSALMMLATAVGAIWGSFYVLSELVGLVKDTAHLMRCTAKKIYQDAKS